jgi:hypothetical protein
VNVLSRVASFHIHIVRHVYDVDMTRMVQPTPGLLHCSLRLLKGELKLKLNEIPGAVALSPCSEDLNSRSRQRVCSIPPTVSNATDVVCYDFQTPKWAPHLTTVRRIDPCTGKYELAVSVRDEANKPVAGSLYGGAFEPEQ